MQVIESAESLWREGQELFKRDAEETFIHGEPLSINIDYYRKLDQMGRFVAVSARKNGKMVGYFGFLLSMSIQTSEVVATCFGVYIDKEHRGGRTFLNMYLEALTVLQQKGVSKIRISTSPKHDISKMLERLGLQKEETIYSRLI